MLPLLHATSRAERLNSGYLGIHQASQSFFRAIHLLAALRGRNAECLSKANVLVSFALRDDTIVEGAAKRTRQPLHPKESQLLIGHVEAASAARGQKHVIFAICADGLAKYRINSHNCLGLYEPGTPEILEPLRR